MRRVTGSVGLLVVSFSVIAHAERQIESLPHSEDFDAESQYQDLIWTTQGCEHTWSTAGYAGGAAKFTPPLQDQGACGLGQFILSGLPEIPEQLNLRFLIYHGSTWRELGPSNKLVIMNREGNEGRPMIITREFDDWETWGACDGTVCKYEEGDFWPLGGDRLRIGDPPNAREEEWISVEFEANTETGMIRLYVDTLDGELSDLYVERYMDDTGPGGTWSYIDLVGGYMEGAAEADPNNYFMIDELAIDSERIGPPAGFGAARDAGAATSEPPGNSDAGASEAAPEADAAAQTGSSSSDEAELDAAKADAHSASDAASIARPDAASHVGTSPDAGTANDGSVSTERDAAGSASTEGDDAVQGVDTDDDDFDDTGEDDTPPDAGLSSDNSSSDDSGCACTVGRHTAFDPTSMAARTVAFGALFGLWLARRRKRA